MRSLRRAILPLLWLLPSICVLVPAPAQAGMSVDDMCRSIHNDIATYRATGRPCPCPYSVISPGVSCGNRSAWAKPNGRMPRCYFDDVTGERPPNRSPHSTRQSWPDPPPCTPLSALHPTSPPKES